jgi:hypothetical protein
VDWLPFFGGAAAAGERPTSVRLQEFARRAISLIESATSRRSILELSSDQFDQ